MRFLLTSEPSDPATLPSPETLAAVGKFVAEETKAGRLIATGGLLPSSRGGARVRSSAGTFTVVDGPFTESKELIAGFAIIEVSSLEEAIDMSRRFYAITGGDGEGLIQQIV